MKKSRSAILVHDDEQGITDSPTLGNGAVVYDDDDGDGVDDDGDNSEDSEDRGPSTRPSNAAVEKPVNFSRRSAAAARGKSDGPRHRHRHRRRPDDEQQQQQQQHESDDVQAILAYYEPDSVLPSSSSSSSYPSEPRFALDSNPGETQALCGSGEVASGRQSAGSKELTWDDQRGEMVTHRRRPPLQKIDDQRHPGLQSRNASSSMTKVSSSSNSNNSNSNNSSNSSSNNTTTSQSATAESARKLAVPLKSILKKTEVEQYSEHASSEAGESTGSRHTLSENGSGGTYDTLGNWHASDVDASCLSDKEVRKLEKKGIDPSLYVEMKQAKGKKLVGVLTGSSFVG